MCDRHCLPVPLSALLHPHNPPISTYSALQTALTCCRPPAPWTPATQAVLEGFVTVYALHLLRERAVIISLLLHAARALLQTHPSHLRITSEDRLEMRSGTATRTLAPLPVAMLMSIVASAMIPLRIVLYLQWTLRHLYVCVTLCAIKLCVLTLPPPFSQHQLHHRLRIPCPHGQSRRSQLLDRQSCRRPLQVSHPQRASPHGTQPTLLTHNRPPPPDPTAAHPQTYPTLTFSSLNVGGVEITPNRLCHLLGGYQQLPHTISLQEYRPSSLSTARDHERVAHYWGYHLLMSSPSSKEGVALLVHTSVAPSAPAMKVHVPGRLISAQLPLLSDPLLPEVNVCSFYGPNSSKERPRCEKALEPLLQTCSIILGDYNGVTVNTDTTAIQPNLWPWLVARERSGAMVDLVRP